MNKIEKDRTGETCQSCKKGKLYPTGYISSESNEDIEDGEHKRSIRKYKCDVCGKETSGIVIGFKENTGSRSTSASGVAKSRK